MNSTGSTRLIVTLTLLIAICGGVGYGVTRHFAQAEAACPAYIVHWGDTLAKIAARNHTTVTALAKLNGIRDVNRIYVGQKLCVAGGQVVVHDPLEWSTRAQVKQLLLDAANRYGVPQNLVLAVAWQESGWTQHVIAWDGGIGTMQLMPYTAKWLNNYLGMRYDPYRLHDNIELGVVYLHLLWQSFGGDLPRIISAYNEGEHNVRTRGIFNWRYVTSVTALMRHFS